MENYFVSCLFPQFDLSRIYVSFDRTCKLHYGTIYLNDTYVCLSRIYDVKCSINSE